MIPKKAMMDDLFDFLFTVMVLFFILIFVNVALVYGQQQKETQSVYYLEQVKVNDALLNFLRLPVTLSEDKQANMLDIISLVDVNTNRDERIKAFQDNAKIYFSNKFPGSEYWEGGYPWKISVYGLNEPLDDLSSLYNSYGYNTKSTCDPTDTQSSYSYIIKLKKVDGQEVNLVFCIYKSYLENRASNKNG